VLDAGDQDGISYYVTLNALKPLLLNIIIVLFLVYVTTL
jgi:hypothetical protein